MKNNKFKGYFYLTLSAICASFYYIAFKASLNSNIKPSTFIAGIFLFGFLYSVFTRVIDKRSFVLNKINFLLGVQFAVFSIIGNYANGKSLEILSPSLTSLFLKTQFLFILAGAFFIFKEKITYKFLFGIIIAVIGASIISSKENYYFSFDISKIIGIFWAIVSALSFASITLTQKKYSNIMHPPSINSIRFFIAFIIFTPFNILDLINVSFYNFFLILVASVFGSIISRLFSMYALKYVNVSLTPVFSMFTPIFTLVFAVVFIKEIPLYKDLLGSIIILIGLALSLIFYNNKTNENL